MTYRPYSSIKSTGFEFSYTNSSGVTMPKTTPVRVRSDGDVDFIDVSVESDVFALAGVTSASCTNGSKAGVTIMGRVEDTGLSFDFGEPIYISKTGDLTNTKPSIGVNGFILGDYIVRVGVIGKNETNPALKDLILELRLIGQV
jgi:hypothetical protein